MQAKVIRFVLVFAVLSVSALHVIGGHPGPPQRHSVEYRQANMLMLRFQDALAAGRWQDALALCSDRIRAKAAESVSPEAFFRDTMPVENVLAQDFGCWSCGTNFYGMVINLPDRSVKPVVQTKRVTSFVQWNWAIYPTNSTWVVDYPPVKLEEQIARKKAARQAREDKIKQIRQNLEPKLRGIKTHLTAVSESFVIGSPMLFRVELINFGSTPVHYQNSGVRYHPLSVFNEKREAVPAHETPLQIMVVEGELAAGASAVVADNIDISQNHELNKPGKYFVQFDGERLDIGEPIQSDGPGRFGESEGMWPLSFLPVLTKFPSEVIEIEVTDGQKR